jgi:propanol-preferring alcohol dehydrogenase
MRAMAVTAYGSPLELIELPKPEPAPGYATIQVVTCGLCFSDVKTIRGKMPWSDSVELPHVAGHEVFGRVVEVNGPSRLRRGDRVVAYHLAACRRCSSCLRGEEQLCLEPVAWLGFRTRGGFQEFVSVKIESLLPVPDEIPDAEAAILTCAMGSSYRAVVTRAGLRPGERALVFGLGGVGIHAALIAQALGAEVLGVEASQDKVDAALGAGVAAATTAAELEDRTRVLTGGDGVDVVIETTGVPELVELGRRLSRPGSRIVCVGYQVGAMLSASSDQLVLREHTVMGSRYARRDEMVQLMRMVARGLVRPVVSDVLDLEDLNQAIARLEEGRVAGRLVLRVARDR